MIYVIGLILPPLALFLNGKPFQAALNAVLCVGVIILATFGCVGGLAWVAPVVWAWAVAHDRRVRKRDKQFIKNLERAKQKT